MKHVMLLLLFSVFSLAQIAYNAEKDFLDEEGEETISFAPDQVILGMSIRKESKDFRATQKKNQESFSTFIDFCKKQGVGKDKIILGFPQISKINRGDAYVPKYTVEQRIYVTLKDFSMYEEVLAFALEQGIDEQIEVQLMTSQLEEMQNKARALALADAKKNVAQRETQLGVRIKDLMDIRYTVDPTPLDGAHRNYVLGPHTEIVNEKAKSEGSPSVGKLYLNATAHVRYQLKEKYER